MKAPRFWQSGGPAAAALAPLGALTAAATARRVARPGVRLGVPVICAGNLTAGGAGKTPTVMHLIADLAARGVAPHVVSRGHGGTERGPLRVDPGRHAAAQVGDEPLLLAALAPTWIARDRAAGGRAAEAAGAGAVILDDGFQNPGLVKDLSILVIDAETGFGNGRCLPAGPLREPPEAGRARADLALLIGPEDARAAARPLAGDLPVAEGEVAPLPTGMDWAGLRVVAFAGIGRPAKFFATLRALGAEIVEAVPLADHAELSPALMRRLAARAAAAGARLVCTEKDAVRLPPAWRGEVLPLPVRLRIEPGGPLEAALGRLFGEVRPRGGGRPRHP